MTVSERVILLQLPPSGLAHNDDDELISCAPFVGKSGDVIDKDDSAYNTSRPTGYEPVYFLVDFGTQRLWLPSAMFFGDDADGNENWITYLRTIATGKRQMKPRHPIQPLMRDKHGIVRFVPNKIVRHLLDYGGIDLNHISKMGFSQDDQTQFAQLIGYSLSGFHELPYVPDEVADRASKMAILSGLPDSGCRSTGCDIHCGVEWEDCVNETTEG